MVVDSVYSKCLTKFYFRKLKHTVDIVTCILILAYALAEIVICFLVLRSYNPVTVHAENFLNGFCEKECNGYMKIALYTHIVLSIIMFIGVLMVIISIFIFYIF